MSDYAQNCIHLRACRRLCKIAKQYYKPINNRNCNEDCSAYEPDEPKYTYTQVVDVMHGACRDGANGYDPYDLLITDYI